MFGIFANYMVVLLVSGGKSVESVGICPLQTPLIYSLPGKYY